MLIVSVAAARALAFAVLHATALTAFALNVNALVVFAVVAAAVAAPILAIAVCVAALVSMALFAAAVVLFALAAAFVGAVTAAVVKEKHISPPYEYVKACRRLIVQIMTRRAEVLRKNTADKERDNRKNKTKRAGESDRRYSGRSGDEKLRA